MADDLDIHKRTGMYIRIATISWCCKWQKLVALSSTEAEYISATEASKETI
jgi:hypothetical protein